MAALAIPTALHRRMKTEVYGFIAEMRNKSITSADRLVFYLEIKKEKKKRELCFNSVAIPYLKDVFAIVMGKNTTRL